MAKKKKSDKKRKKKNRPLNKKSSAISKLLNASAPLHGCWINQDWKTMDYACVVVARKMKTGLIMFGSIWIDTANQQIEDCFSDVNLTEEWFYQHVLKRNTSIDFLCIKLEFIIDLMAQTVAHMVKNHQKFPTGYSQSIKIIADHLPTEQESGKHFMYPKEETTERFIYDFQDRETVETELRQLSVLEEVEMSSPDARVFKWNAEERKAFFQKSEQKKIWGYIILHDDYLSLEIMNENKIQYMQNALLQYLGTSISPRETKEK